MRLRHAILSILAFVTLTGCDSVDDDRIPSYPVSLTFENIGNWELYGISGAGQYRSFIYTNTERIPADYPFKGLDRTGFGGLLLICDPNGEYLAYDLACPVEVKNDIRIYVDSDNSLAGIAKCPKCQSTYNLFSYGAPASGEALKKKYGLQRYHVSVGSSTPPYAVVTR